MEFYEIHDDSDSTVVTILENEFKKIPHSEPYVSNYHPSYSYKNSNIFYLLRNGRYIKGKGKYYIVCEENKYIASAGWNQYDYEKDVVLLLTRMFVTKEHRNHFHIGKYVLPMMINETENYNRLWITCNEYNKNIYNWFYRNSKNKAGSLSNQWPDIYKKFLPIGNREVNFVNQFVLEYKK